MTDDPIRESVARAIWTIENPHANWDAFMSWAKGSPEDCEPSMIGFGKPKLFEEAREEYTKLMQKADAALLACGYEEMRRALEAAEKAERYHMNCKHCDGLEQPEACEKCFPKADDARLARWASLKAIGSKLAPREPRAALSRTQGETK